MMQYCINAMLHISASLAVRVSIIWKPNTQTKKKWSRIHIIKRRQHADSKMSKIYLAMKTQSKEYTKTFFPFLCGTDCNFRDLLWSEIFWYDFIQSPGAKVQCAYFQKQSQALVSNWAVLALLCDVWRTCKLSDLEKTNVAVFLSVSRKWLELSQVTCITIVLAVSI